MIWRSKELSVMKREGTHDQGEKKNRKGGREKERENSTLTITQEKILLQND